MAPRTSAGAKPERPRSLSRQRAAHRAGATGRNLSPGLASLADQDPSIDAAHDAGRNGASFDDFAGQYYSRPESPRAPRTSSRRRTSSARRSGAPEETEPAPSSGGFFSESGGAASDAAGLVLGAIAYALLLSIITMGAGGPKAWFEAKFLNVTPSQPNGVTNPITKPATGATPSVNAPSGTGKVSPPSSYGAGGSTANTTSLTQLAPPPPGTVYA